MSQPLKRNTSPALCHFCRAGESCGGGMCRYTATKGTQIKPTWTHHSLILSPATAGVSFLPLSERRSHRNSFPTGVTASVYAWQEAAVKLTTSLTQLQKTPTFYSWTLKSPKTRYTWLVSVILPCKQHNQVKRWLLSRGKKAQVSREPNTSGIPAYSLNS